MRAHLHLITLVTFLICLGLGFTVYQHYELGIPFSPNQSQKVWTVEASVEFKASPKKPVKIELYIPHLKRDYVVLNESFIARNYGVNIRYQEDNRIATWTKRKAYGGQKLYYRLSVMKTKLANTEENKDIPKDTTVNPTQDFIGAKKIAAEALIKSIRTQSADIATFTSEAIKRLNGETDNAETLLDNAKSRAQIAKIAVDLLSLARIKAQVVKGIYLEAAMHSKLKVWVRSFNGKNWVYFNPITGLAGLPDDVLIWKHGSGSITKGDGITSDSLSFSVKPADIDAVQLVQQAGSITEAPMIKFSLLSLPVQIQALYKILVMVPVGVFIILLLRSFVGIPTFGTFMPVLIAMAFRETHLFWGIALFTFMVSAGLLIRAYLDKLQLLLVPRLAVILTFVVLLMGVVSIFTHKLGIEHGLSIALFPMVILTMTIERMSITVEERGIAEALTTAIGSIFTATLAYLIMTIEWLTHIMFVFPGFIFVFMAFMLLLGRYRGYRISELFRFKEFIELK